MVAATSEESIAKRLGAIRTELVAARVALAREQHRQHGHRLIAEMNLLGQAAYDSKKLGTNAEDRKRAFDAAVAADSHCTQARESVHDAEAMVLKLEAALDSLIDRRREHEWALRKRGIEVMEQMLAAGRVEADYTLGFPHAE